MVREFQAAHSLIAASVQQHAEALAAFVRQHIAAGRSHRTARTERA
jgi:hypothetical protein